MGKESFFEALKTAHNQKILSKIAAQGLVPVARKQDEQARIYSFDQTHQAKICYFYVDESGAKAFKRAKEGREFIIRAQDIVGDSPLNCLQRRTLDGLWSLPLERDFEPSEKPFTTEHIPDRFEWEDRLSNSVLLILKGAACHIKDDTVDLISRMEYTQDYTTSTPFTPDAIQAVLCPKSLEVQLKSIFPPHLVVSVDNCVQSGQELKLPSDNNAFKSTNLYLEGPDYAKTMDRLIANGALKYPFGLHVVRLATRRDFLKIPALTATVNVEAFIAYHKTQDNNQLLRRAAALGEREDVEYALKSLPGVTINAVSASGLTALHAAIAYKALPTITLLLEKNAETNIKGPKGQTAMECAREINLDLDKVKSGEHEHDIDIARLKNDPIVKRMFPDGVPAAFRNILTFQAK